MENPLEMLIESVGRFLMSIRMRVYIVLLSSTKKEK